MTEEYQRQSQETFSRIMEMCGEVPAPFEDCGRSPTFVQDHYINFKRYVWNDGTLDQREKAAIAFAVSFFMRCPQWAHFFSRRMKKLGFTEDGVIQVQAVVSTCSAYNTYFSFAQLAGSPFNGMSVGLRGYSLKAPDLDAKLVELIAVAISTLNACRTCVTGHLAEARGRGASDDMILEAIQLAATVNAGCMFSTFF